MPGELGHSEIPSKSETNEFKQIKPEEGMTVKQARSFWDNLFSKEIVSLAETGNELLSDASDTEDRNEGIDVNEKTEFRPLTEDEKKFLKEKTGMTDANIEKCSVNEDGLIKLKCINEEFAGKKHPETEVPYVEKIVDVNGVKIQVVVPEFPDVIEVLLPDKLRLASEAEQFTYLNNCLKEEIKSNPELRAQFTEVQIAMIERGLKPKGFTWHHNEEWGKMQLTKTDIHERTRHTGGNSIWSGGN